MTRPGAAATIAEGPLSPAQASLILELASAAQAADGVAPLSEHVLLRVRYGSREPARDLIAAVGDVIVGYAHLDAPGGEAQGDDVSGELVVHPTHRGQGHGTSLVSALTRAADGHRLRIWAHGDLPAAAALARSTRFTRFRALWQMRASLAGARIAEPALPAGVTLRSFRPGQDEEAWLAVNRRAFARHPEQGSWTRADLELRESEAWFDPDGFFLAERGGAVIGFHWTKVHPAGTEADSPIGEVYVVGVDPAGQGGGLGRALTLAGLRYLQGRGLGQVMLYVDEDNEPAVRMYTKLGFGRWHTDVMYRSYVPERP